MAYRGGALMSSVQQCFVNWVEESEYLLLKVPGFEKIHQEVPLFSDHILRHTIAEGHTPSEAAGDVCVCCGRTSSEVVDRYYQRNAPAGLPDKRRLAWMSIKWYKPDEGCTQSRYCGDCAVHFLGKKDYPCEKQ
jgi:hypothetical protein